ncbi:MAG TPA: HlyD family efflux transporter periplasmic adaptor subunit [Coleofasciculaceae cyanobacterium]
MTSQKVIDSSNQSELTEYRTQQLIHLKRPVFWSYIFASLILGAGLAAGAWAAIARFDQKVLATGTLEQNAPPQPIQIASEGVVQEIYVQEGKAVEKDEPLATFKPTEIDSESLNQQKKNLIKVNDIYEDALKGSDPGNKSDLPPLIQLRTQLQQETQYYQALVSDKNLDQGAKDELNASQQRLLAASSPELQARVSAARMQMQELEQQRSQVKEKLAEAQKLLAVNQDFSEKVTEVPASRQRYQRQNQEIQSIEADAERLTATQKRLTTDLSQAKEQLQSAIALAQKDVVNQITQNQRQIAQIDLQLKQAHQENQQRIAAIDAKLAALMQPQQLKAPVDGVVFDLQPITPGFVASANQTLLTVVPDNSLVASVFLKERDIGVVKQGMNVNVNLTSLQNGALASSEGKVLWVDSNVLPPVPERSYYAIPAKIQLQRPFLQANGKPIRLQPGTAVNGEIVLPYRRTAWDIVQTQLDKKLRTFAELVK